MPLIISPYVQLRYLSPTPQEHVPKPNTNRNPNPTRTLTRPAHHTSSSYSTPSTVPRTFVKDVPAVYVENTLPYVRIHMGRSRLQSVDAMLLFWSCRLCAFVLAEVNGTRTAHVCFCEPSSSLLCSVVNQPSSAIVRSTLHTSLTRVFSLLLTGTYAGGGGGYFGVTPLSSQQHIVIPSAEV